MTKRGPVSWEHQAQIRRMMQIQKSAAAVARTLGVSKEALWQAALGKPVNPTTAKRIASKLDNS